MLYICLNEFVHPGHKGLTMLNYEKLLVYSNSHIKNSNPTLQYSFISHNSVSTEVRSLNIGV